MTQMEVTLIVGLAGLIATLIASGIGHYFTAKSRSAAQRQALYSKQLDLITRIGPIQGKLRAFVTLLSIDDGEYRSAAESDIRTTIQEFGCIQDEAAAILPIDLWVTIKKLFDCLCSSMASVDETGKISKEDFSTITAYFAKIAISCRSVAGVDELTEENMKLFSATKSYRDLVNTDIGYFKNLHDQINDNAASKS